MNRNNLIGFAVVIAVLALAVIVLWQLFEIYPASEWVYPSEEAMSNGNLAFDRWLEANRIPVRITVPGDYSTISRARERQIFIQASLFDWSEETLDYLINWVENGGHLFFSLDEIYNKESISFLEGFGISFSDSSLQRFSNVWSEEFPNFDQRFSFKPLSPKNEDWIFIDWNGEARLVQTRYGNGTLTVSGRPWFLASAVLDREPNARLAWGIFASNGDGVRENGGWLFIRGNARYQNPSLLGSLFAHGNFKPLLVSILVLLTAAFWAAIPIFGLVREEREKPGKAIKERFQAEGRFLKNQKALGFYRDLYIREIRRKLSRKGSAFYTAETEEQLKPFLKETVRPGDFSEMISNFNNILERI